MSKVSHKLVIASASGVAACLLLGTGIFWFLKSRAGDSPDTLMVSTVRPTETIRYAPPPAEKKAKGGPTDTANVQPPQGTIRRMEAISGTFSKK